MRHMSELPDFSNKSSQTKERKRFPSQFKPLDRAIEHAHVKIANDFHDHAPESLMADPFDMPDDVSGLDEINTSEEFSAADDVLLSQDSLSVDENISQLSSDDLSSDLEAVTQEAEAKTAQFDTNEIINHISTRLDEVENRLVDHIFNSLLAPLKQITQQTLAENALEKMRHEIFKLAKVKEVLSIRMIGPANLISAFQNLDQNDALQSIKIEFVEEDGKPDLVTVIDSNVLSTRIAELHTIMTGLSDAQ